MDNMQLKEYEKLKKQKEKQLKRQNAYNKENYERFGIVVEKGMKDKIKEHYIAKGYKNFNSYIVQLIKNDMKS